MDTIILILYTRLLLLGSKLKYRKTAHNACCYKRLDLILYIYIYIGQSVLYNIETNEAKRELSADRKFATC